MSAELGARAHARGPRVGVPSADVEETEPADSRRTSCTKKRRGEEEADADAAVRTSAKRIGARVVLRPRWRRVLALAPASRRGMRRRRRDRSGGGSKGSVETVKSDGQAQRQPDDLQLAALHRQGHGPGLRKGDRHLGQVHRGHQRQRRVLRQDAAAAGRGRIGRPQHLRPHRLDGEQDARARLPAEPRQVGAPERRKEPVAEPAAPAVRPQPRLHGAVAERDDRDHRQQGPGARRARRSATCSTPNTRARSTCSTKCAKRCRW